MAKARKNPLGRTFPGATTVVVGNGEYVHLFHPEHKRHICNSGKNAGKAPANPNADDLRAQRQPVYYATKARYVTCWRCLKLASMNLDEGRRAWESRQDVARGSRG